MANEGEIKFIEANENDFKDSVETKTEVQVQTFTNDISEELKARIRAEGVKRIDEILEQPTLTRGDLVHLAGVSHGSIKSRAEKMNSAAEIITAIFDGVRAEGVRTPSVASVKSFLESLSPEEKQKFLDQVSA